MKEKHANKLKMFERVIASMNEHLGSWKHVDALSETNDLFVRNFKKLTDHLPDAEISLDDLKGSYREKKNQLMEHLGSMKEVVSIYLADHRKKDLKQFSKLNKKNLHEMKDKQLQDLAAFFSKVFKHGDDPAKKGKPVASYGITDEMAERLKSLNKEFSEVKKTLKESRKRHREALKNIQYLIIQNERILKRRMDKFVKILEGQHPEFADVYMEARESGKKADKNKKADKKDAEVIEPTEESKPSPDASEESKPVKQKPGKTATSPGSAGKTAAKKAASTSGSAGKTTPK